MMNMFAKNYFYIFSPCTIKQNVVMVNGKTVRDA